MQIWILDADLDPGSALKKMDPVPDHEHYFKISWSSEQKKNFQTSLLFSFFFMLKLDEFSESRTCLACLDLDPESKNVKFPADPNHKHWFTLNTKKLNIIFSFLICFYTTQKKTQ